MDCEIERIVDLTHPSANNIFNMSIDEARQRLAEHRAEAVREIDGSFALVACRDITVRMARSLDRPLRYFLAKRSEGPALIVSDRIDAIHQWLEEHGLGYQFHPSYTRMVPAHYVVEIQLVGCPDPDPTYTRFFNPKANSLSTDLDEIGTLYVGALEEALAKWLQALPPHELIGVCFSGGIDSGAVFLITYHLLQRLGMNPGRLKAFSLDFGDGPDAHQAHQFLSALGLSLFLETINADPSDIDVSETIRILEDYKPLDVECAAMGLALCRGIRKLYPDWRYLLDGDGGDENLKDYPIEENPELTIKSVINNPMLYHEGWGVGKIKHSLTYSGGLSRSIVRTYAPARRFGFEGFSPFTRPKVVEVAEQIPFRQLTGYNVDRLYALKGEIVSRGVQAITGMKMPVFPKRRFQHGALKSEYLHKYLPSNQAECRNQFSKLYS